jgi:hypothetical protein
LRYLNLLNLFRWLLARTRVRTIDLYNLLGRLHPRGYLIRRARVD